MLFVVHTEFIFLILPYYSGLFRCPWGNRIADMGTETCAKPQQKNTIRVHISRDVLYILILSPLDEFP